MSPQHRAVGREKEVWVFHPPPHRAAERGGTCLGTVGTLTKQSKTVRQSPEQWFSNLNTIRVLCRAHEQEFLGP